MMSKSDAKVHKKITNLLTNMPYMKLNLIAVGVMLIDKVGVSLLQLRKFSTLKVIQTLETFDFPLFVLNRSSKTPKIGQLKLKINILLNKIIFFLNKIQAFFFFSSSNEETRDVFSAPISLVSVAAEVLSES
jgi:hypothetical protein